MRGKVRVKPDPGVLGDDAFDVPLSLNKRWRKYNARKHDKSRKGAEAKSALRRAGLAPNRTQRIFKNSLRTSGAIPVYTSTCRLTLYGLAVVSLKSANYENIILRCTVSQRSAHYE